MCTYHLSFSDSLIERVRPFMTTGVDETAWMQQQFEMLLQQIVYNNEKESAQTWCSTLSPDLQKILAMPILDDADVGLNGEIARERHYQEEYAL